MFLNLLYTLYSYLKPAKPCNYFRREFLFFSYA